MAKNRNDNHDVSKVKVMQSVASEQVPAWEWVRIPAAASVHQYRQIIWHLPTTQLCQICHTMTKTLGFSRKLTVQQRKNCQMEKITEPFSYENQPMDFMHCQLFVMVVLNIAKFTKRHRHEIPSLSDFLRICHSSIQQFFKDFKHYIFFGV